MRGERPRETTRDYERSRETMDTTMRDNRDYERPRETTGTTTRDHDGPRDVLLNQTRQEAQILLRSLSLDQSVTYFVHSGRTNHFFLSKHKALSYSDATAGAAAGASRAAVITPTRAVVKIRAAAEAVAEATAISA